MKKRLNFQSYLLLPMVVFLLGTLQSRAQDTYNQAKGTIAYTPKYDPTRSYADGSLVRGKIADASSDDWSYVPGKQTFTTTENGGYECESEICVDPGKAWPEWRAGMNYVLMKDNGEPQAVLDAMSIGTVTDNTASIKLTYTLFNVPENAVCKVDVHELSGDGTWSFVIPTPESFTASNLVMLTDLSPGGEYDFNLTVSIVSDNGQSIATSDAMAGSFSTILKTDVDDEGQGNMVYQFDVNAGINNPMLNSPESYVVYGSYKNGVITVSNMIYNYLPIEFTVNLANGELLAEDQVAYKYFNGNMSYYCSVAAGQPIVRGSVRNVKGVYGEWSEMTIEPWGNANVENNSTLFNSAIFNTRIIFDFKIPGLMESETSAIKDFYEETAEPRYFTIDGVEVRNPEKGRIYIKLENNKVSKVVL